MKLPNMKSPEMSAGGSKTPETSEEMTTVRDIKNQFKAKFGKSENWSDKQRDFWNRLNKLGARNMDKIPPETVPDIDATVELSDEEILKLQREIAELEI